MKKIMLLMCFLLLGSMVNVQESRGEEKPKHTIGYCAPVFGWIKYNGSGNIKSIIGPNLALGISYKNYFGSGAEIGKFAVYWEVGTAALLVPYSGIGTSLFTSSNLFFDIDVNLLNIILSIGASPMFLGLPQPVGMLGIGVMF